MYSSVPLFLSCVSLSVYVCVSVFPFCQLSAILSVMLAMTWYFLNVFQGPNRRISENSQQIKRDYFCESKRIKKRKKGRKIFVKFLLDRPYIFVV